MGDYAEEILGVCSALNYKSHLLDAERAKLVLASIEQKFATQTGYRPLWERIENYRGFHNPKGWSWIGDFVGNTSIFVFFDLEDDTSVIQMTQGQYISKVLAECTGFVFYVTDLDFDYLICFNKHDVLVGTGTAKEWVNHVGASIREGHA